MSPDEIIIMLIEQLEGTSIMYNGTPKIVIGYAEEYLRDHGWRRDGLTGESWIKE